MSKKRTIIPKVIFIDAETGEQITPTEQEMKQVTKKFFKGFNTGMLKLAKKNLSKVAGRLALYMLSTMAYQNVFNYQCNSIALKLKLKPSAVSLAFHELLDFNFLVPTSDSPKEYLINPEFGFRGSNPKPTQDRFNFLLKTFTQKREDDFFEKTEKTFSDEPLKQQQTANFEELKHLLTRSQKYGESSKQKIMNYLLSLADHNQTVFKQIKDMVADLNISKMTIIPFLHFLENTNLISRPERGLIKLNPNFIQLINSL